MPSDTYLKLIQMFLFSILISIFLNTELILTLLHSLIFLLPWLTALMTFSPIKDCLSPDTGSLRPGSGCEHQSGNHTSKRLPLYAPSTNYHHYCHPLLTCSWNCNKIFDPSLIDSQWHYSIFYNDPSPILHPFIKGVLMSKSCSLQCV